MTTRPLAFLAPALGLLVTLPAAAADKPVRGTVKAPDGLTVAYDVRGKGDTALVFLHGWSCDREFWKHQLDAFAGDYRVVAVDLGGHGESGTDRKEWTVLGLTGDAGAVVKHLGLKRVVLVGHSMGGIISLDLARRLPGTVVGVVGVDTLANAEFKWPEETAKQVTAAFEADFKDTMAGAIRGMLPEKPDPELLRWITGRAQARDPKVAIALFRDFPRLDMKALFRDARVPIRCVNSAPNTQFAVPTAVEVNKKYADFDAVIMETTGHFPMLEKPTEFNDKLRAVLKGFEPKK